MDVKKKIKRVWEKIAFASFNVRLFFGIGWLVSYAASYIIYSTILGNKYPVTIGILQVPITLFVAMWVLDGLNEIREIDKLVKYDHVPNVYKTTTKTGFVCKTDFDYHIEHDHHGVVIYPSLQSLIHHKNCVVSECGAIKVKLLIEEVLITDEVNVDDNYRNKHKKIEEPPSEGGTGMRL